MSCLHVESSKIFRGGAETLYSRCTARKTLHFDPTNALLVEHSLAEQLQFSPFRGIWKEEMLAVFLFAKITYDRLGFEALEPLNEFHGFCIMNRRELRGIDRNQCDFV